MKYFVLFILLLLAIFAFERVIEENARPHRLAVLTAVVEGKVRSQFLDIKAEVLERSELPSGEQMLEIAKLSFDVQRFRVSMNDEPEAKMYEGPARLFVNTNSSAWLKQFSSNSPVLMAVAWRHSGFIMGLHSDSILVKCSEECLSNLVEVLPR